MIQFRRVGSVRTVNRMIELPGASGRNRTATFWRAPSPADRPKIKLPPSLRRRTMRPGAHRRSELRNGVKLTGVNIYIEECRSERALSHLPPHFPPWDKTSCAGIKIFVSALTAIPRANKTHYVSPCKNANVSTLKAQRHFAVAVLGRAYPVTDLIFYEKCTLSSAESTRVARRERRT